ncbi:hypothetical protein [Streptacidiphilus jiangxiensis]|uniref:Uncharacterized protein n=1 Tax=Streptacidiphilus jiangxiensis TaxID=235985 RepID=A0A1H8B6C8_STRJI|nr:hypothetical protein [Streptacidiphilus jiangxiensis]SEM77598.1 hypothetical protein SAMN05414137_1573 [Streptacidiphilus jiangxiensis]
MSASELNPLLAEEVLTALQAARRGAEAAATVGSSLDVEALVSRSYTAEMRVGSHRATVVFAAGLADSGIAHGEHLDIRAAVSLRHRVPLTLSYGLVSTDSGASWTVALSRSGRGWLASAQQMLEAARPRVTEIAHDPEHRTGLAPVIDAARHVAALRALFALRQEREQLARAAARTLAARAVLDRYGYSEADLRRLGTHLARLAPANRSLIGW